MKREKKGLLAPIYLITMGLFINIAIAARPMDFGAIVIGLVMCILIAYAHFIVRRFFNKGDRYLVSLVSILPVIGVALIYRLSPSLALKQIIWFILGISLYCAIVILLPDLKRFANLRYLYMVMTIIFMAMATFIGREINGSKNWVMVGGFSFQPSEFGKIFFVLYLASSLRKYKDFKSLVEPLFIVLLSLAFMVIQKDLGSALIFACIALAMVYTATGNLKYILSALALGSVGAVCAYFLFDHIKVRVSVWADPFKDRYGSGHQIIQGLYAIASGGLLGQGLYRGSPSLVPVVESDYIFTLLAEEMGMLFSFGVIIIYLFLFLRSMRVALNVKAIFSSLLSVGFAVMIAMQLIVIVGGVLNMIPLTGITMPLISYGGTSMLTIFFALGIIQKTSEEEA